MKLPTVSAILCSSLVVEHTDGFLGQQQPIQYHTIQTSSSSLNLVPRANLESILKLISSPASSLPFLLASSLATPVVSTPPTTAFSITDPLVEAEVLNDLAHVALDLFTFFGPAKLAMRCAALVGRVLAMAADYIPDHHMVPEEWMFQMFMLSMTTAGLVQAALPVALSMTQGWTFRDGRAYNVVFGPAGMTQQQFQALKAIAFEWKTVGAGQVISNYSEDEAMYWLYQGQALVSKNNKVIFNVTRSSFKGNVGKFLLGEMRLLQTLDKNQKTAPSMNTTVVAGASGATVLRLCTKKLQLLLQTDQDLAESMRNLAVRGMQDKLAAHLEEN